MQPQLKSEMQAASPVSPVFVEAERLFDRWNEIGRLIAQRAYELFDSRGREDGRNLEDWLHAESELLRAVPVETKESDDLFTVRADMSGLSPGEIEFSLTPRLLLINGRPQSTDEQHMEDNFHKITGEVFRAIELPAEVDPAKATATFEDGIFSLVLPKSTN